MIIDCGYVLLRNWVEKYFVGINLFMVIEYIIVLNCKWFIWILVIWLKVVYLYWLI